MKDFLKLHLKEGKEVIFNNERTFTDDLRSAECTFGNGGIQRLSKCYRIHFNGVIFSYKRFDSFFRKFSQLKSDYNLELKSW